MVKVIHYTSISQKIRGCPKKQKTNGFCGEIVYSIGLMHYSVVQCCVLAILFTDNLFCSALTDSNSGFYFFFIFNDNF